MTGYEGTGVTLPEQREDPWAKTPSLEDLQSAIAKGRVIGEGVTTTFSPRCPDPHKSSRVLSQQFSYQTEILHLRFTLVRLAQFVNCQGSDSHLQNWTVMKIIDSKSLG